MHAYIRAYVYKIAGIARDQLGSVARVNLAASVPDEPRAVRQQARGLELDATQAGPASAQRQHVPAIGGAARVGHDAQALGRALLGRELAALEGEEVAVMTARRAQNERVTGEAPAARRRVVHREAAAVAAAGAGKGQSTPLAVQTMEAKTVAITVAVDNEASRTAGIIARVASGRNKCSTSVF